MQLDNIKPDDRVLLIGVPDFQELLELSARLTHGLVVVLAPEDHVHECRRITRDCDNVMFTVQDEPGVIPWQDGFFTLIQSASELSPEMQRVVFRKDI
jgi:hypothetical protein